LQSSEPSFDSAQQILPPHFLGALENSLLPPSKGVCRRKISTEGSIQSKHDNDHNKVIQNRLNQILLESYNASVRTSALDQLTEDADLVEWQKFSVKAATETSLGPKMTFPVLVRGSGKNTSQKRTKRWGNGQMALVPAVREEQGITGPSSYLELYKLHTEKNSKASSRFSLA